MLEYPITERTHKIDGANVWCTTYGNPENPPLLYLHGVGSPYSLKIIELNRLHKELSKYFYVIAPEHPGFMRSEAPLKVWDIVDYEKYIHKLVKIYRLKDPIIFGHSFGGLLAAIYASKHSKEIKLLVLAAPAISFSATPHFHRFVIKTGNLLMMLFKLTFIPAIIKNLIPLLIMSTPKTVKDPCMYENLGVTLNTLIPADLSPILLDITAPTLIFWGKYDYAIPVKNAELVHRLIEGSTLNIYRAEHLVVATHIKEIIAAIQTKLKEIYG